MRQLGGRSLGKFRMGVDAGADGSATQRDFAQFFLGLLGARDAALDLSGIAEKFLAKSNGVAS